MSSDSREVPTSDGGVRSTIIVPREIVNADSVFVVQWMIADGQPVESGAVVCEIETSKAVVSVEAGASGYLRHEAAVGVDVPVGGVLGFVMADANTATAKARAASPVPAAAPNISAKARRKIDELGLDVSLFAGMGLVREEDVLATVARQGERIAGTDPRGTFRVESLGSVQRRVARAMEQSVARTPVSYVERSVDLDALRRVAHQLTAESKVIVSPVDLLVSAVARAGSQFGRFNAWFVSETDIRIFDHVHVGVAVDIESDLFVVVVKEADTKDIRTIASELRKLQYLAQRRRLDVDQLTGGTITVSSMIGSGVHGFRPLLFPQQSAIVGITDPDPSGNARLILGFDHRLANGSQAAAFLGAIGKALTT